MRSLWITLRGSVPGEQAMNCIVCGASECKLYSAADNSVIVRLCCEHINRVPGAVPLPVQSEKCESGCSMVGHCCRTSVEENK